MTDFKLNVIKILLIFTLIMFIINSKLIINSVYNSTYLFFNNVFVYLFPFLILSKFILYFNILDLFKIKSQSIIVILLSMITGAPSNAVYIKNLYDNNLIDDDELENLLITTTNPSIFFITSFIGIILLDNKIYSYIIFSSIYISNFIIYLIINNKSKYNNIIINSNKKNIFIEFKYFIKDSIETLFLILGNLVIFNIIIDIINLFIKNNVILTLLSILLEITTSITKISLLNINIYLKLPLITFACLFTSISIFMQIKSILNNFNYKRYIKYKIITSLIGFIICYLTVIIFF